MKSYFMTMLALIMLVSACTSLPGSLKPAVSSVPRTAVPSLTASVYQDRLAFVVKGTSSCSIFIAADGSSLQQVASNADCPYLEASSAWSPDGQSLLYLTVGDAQSWERAWGLVVTVDVNQSTPRHFTLPPNFILNPRFFPTWQVDSKQIIFSAKRNGHEDIYSWTLDSSAPVNLTEAIPGASFAPLPSPDGKQIAFFVFPKMESRELPYCIEGCLGNLYLMNADGSEAHKVTRFDVLSSDKSLWFDECSPIWSYSGHYLAFHAGCTDSNVTRNVYVLNVQTGLVTKATMSENYPRPWATLQGWLPTDDLIFDAAGLDGPARTKLYLTDIEGHNTRPFFNWNNGSDTNSLNIDHPVWTRDGRWVAGEVEIAGTDTIVIGDRETQTLSMTGIQGRSACWSPEGNWLAYVAKSPTSQTNHVWVMQQDGSNAKDLTPDLDGQIIGPLIWSPQP